MDIFVARQPIFDRRQRVYGYEILYRSRAGGAYDSVDGDRASLSVIGNAILLIGLQNITGGKKAFINFTKNLFLDEIGLNLPKELVVIEILEDVEPSEKLMLACKKLREAGYMLALDDFVVSLEQLVPLVDLVDIVKVDFKGSTDEEKRSIARRMLPKGVKLLAEKVETREEFKLALNAGYTYFQGYFFSKPEIVPGRDLPAYKLNHLKILQEVNRRDMEYGALEKAIKQDVSLSYKLMNYINSAYFGLHNVSSIRHAIGMMGENELRKWASLVILTSLGQDKPQEVLVTSLVRANFCEALASLSALKGNESEAFLMGMFSLLDVLVGRPLSDVLGAMPLSEGIKTALLGGRNPYRDLLHIVLNYERGNWANFMASLPVLGLDVNQAGELYLDSIARAEKALQVHGS